MDLEDIARAIAEAAEADDPLEARTNAIAILVSIADFFEQSYADTDDRGVEFLTEAVKVAKQRKLEELDS